MRLAPLCAATAVVVALSSPASAAEPPDPDTEIARKHFKLGSDHYEHQDYAGALVEFETANKVKPAPAFDYNIGRCHDRLEHLPEAIAAYQRYVDSAPRDAAEVAARIKVLEARVADAAAQKQREDALRREEAERHAREQPVAPPAEAKRRSLVAPLVVGALALAAAAAGTGLVLSVAPDYNALADGPGRCARPCDASLVEPLKTRAYVGYALWGVAGAAVAADVALWVLALRGHRAEKVARLPLIVPTLGGVMAEGAF